MNRNVSTRVLTVPARTARPAAPRVTARRIQPKRSGIVGRIVRWTVFLGIIGAIAASFFVKANDDKTYADLYTIPASKWAYNWVHEKISPPEEVEAEAPKKDPGPSALDLKFDAAVAERVKAEALADESVAALEKELDASGKRIDVVQEVGIAASNPTPRKTKVSVVKAVDELAAQAAAQKKIAAALAKRKSEADVKAALAAVPPPPPPPPPPAPPPVVVYHDLRKLHAWPAQPTGTWVRWKKTAGETVSHEDHVLATLTDEAAVVRVEAVPGHQATADRVFVFNSRVVREEPLKVGDAEIACRVVQSGATQRWIPKEGPGADRVALKVQTGDQATVVTELAEEEIPVKGEPKKCLRYTTGDVTVWGHDEVPGFAVRVKTGTETSEVIDWGADATARPALVTKPAVEEKSEKMLLAEAERLKVQGWMMLREALDALKEQPSEPDKLRMLYKDLESASALLTKSKEVFLSAKVKAADPASIDETIAIIGRVLDVAARHSESIKSRLK